MGQAQLELSLFKPTEKFNLSLLDTMLKDTQKKFDFIVIRVVKITPGLSPADEKDSFGVAIGIINNRLFDDYSRKVENEFVGYFEFKNKTVLIQGNYDTGIAYFFSKIDVKKQFALSEEPHFMRQSAIYFIEPLTLANMMGYVYSKGVYKLIESHRRPFYSSYTPEIMAATISDRKSIVINASVAKVWEAITNPEQIKNWWPDSPAEIKTNWEPAGSVIFSGVSEGAPYHDDGVVLAFEKEKLLKFTYLNHLLKLPDIAKNHAIIEFTLTPSDGKTILLVTQSNFEMNSKYEHWNFYLQTSLDTLKKFIEQ
jgi:uncharacterized protein YndB with AHSA1/START domain